MGFIMKGRLWSQKIYGGLNPQNCVCTLLNMTVICVGTSGMQRFVDARGQHSDLNACTRSTPWFGFPQQLSFNTNFIV